MHDLMKSPLAKPELIFKLEVANNTEIYYGFKKQDIVDFHSKQFGNDTITQPYDYGGAMYFAVAVILIYGISIAFLIGTTLRKSRQDDEVKGFLRSYARLDDRKYEKQRVRKALNEKNLLTLVSNTSCVVAATAGAGAVVGIRRPSPWRAGRETKKSNYDEDHADDIEELNILMEDDSKGDTDIDIDATDMDSDAVIEELQIITEDTELSDEEPKELPTPAWCVNYKGDAKSKLRATLAKAESLSDKQYETLDASKLLDKQKGCDTPSNNPKLHNPTSGEADSQNKPADVQVFVSLEDEEDYLEESLVDLNDMENLPV